MKYGVAPPKPRWSVAPYSSPSCSHALVVQGSGPTSLYSCFGGVLLASQVISLPVSIHCIIDKLVLLPILPDLCSGYVVADTSATNHILADKHCFISFKSISNLSICMGNNAYTPVLGHGTAIISLNGKRILVWNVLHVLGLAIPLYSLCTHLKQPSCDFIGTSDVGFLPVFPRLFCRSILPSTAILHMSH